MVKVLVEPGLPSWVSRLVANIEAAMGDRQSRPLRLQRVTTANLPDPADWPGAIMFNITTGKVVASDGAAWTAL